MSDVSDGSSGAVKLHPLNRDFSWEEHAGPFQALSPAQARHYDDEGYVILPDVLDQAMLEQLTVELDHLDEEMEERLRLQDSHTSSISRRGEITFNSGLVAKSRAARRLSVSLAIVEVVIDLLGGDVRLYVDQSVYKKPGTTKSFPWHQDNGYGFCQPQVYLSCWIPLVRSTIENGCVWVWPGHHRVGTFEHRRSDIGWVCKDDDDGAVAVEVEPGDMVVFPSVMPHRSGPNVTSEVRKAYLLQYAVDGAYNVETGRHFTDPNRQYVVASGGVPVHQEGRRRPADGEG